MKPNPPRIYQESDDPRISYELIPNLKKGKAFRSKISTDSQGFRLNGNSQFAIRNSQLIAILGDSITFGYGVENHETLPARIEALLPNYRVLNAAVPGYQLLQETAAYETKVAPMNPDALILVFYFNDLTSETSWVDDLGILRSENWIPIENECYPLNEGILQYIPKQCWLDTHSAFYKAFKKNVHIRHIQSELEKSRKKSQENSEEDDVTEEQIQTYAQQLDALVALLPEQMPRLFVIWPDRNLHEPSRPKIKTLAEQRGFAVVDLYEIFGNEAETLGWDSVHPSVATLQKAAKLVTNAFESIAVPKSAQP